MSRTYRNVKRNKTFRMFRAPHTKNEQTMLKGLLADLANDIEPEFDHPVKVAKINRIKSRAKNIPNYWDDLNISALESKY